MSDKKEIEAGDQAEGRKKSGRATDIPEAARRALVEAGRRRKKMDARPNPPPETEGRNGPDPVRYGDWEKDGIISDF
jgi:hypothetical protein